MPITTSSPFVTEELIFYDDFSSYPLGAFVGGGVYTPFSIDAGTQSWSIQSGNLLRGTVTGVGHGGLRTPAYFRNGRVRYRVRRRETADDPNPDNEQCFIWFRTESLYARLVGDDGVSAKMNGNGIANTAITFSANVWYQFELIVRGPNVTATQYNDGGTPLLSLSGQHGQSSAPGFASFGIAYDLNGSLDFDWIEVYKLPY